MERGKGYIAREGARMRCILRVIVALFLERWLIKPKPKPKPKTFLVIKPRLHWAPTATPLPPGDEWTGDWQQLW